MLVQRQRKDNSRKYSNGRRANFQEKTSEVLKTDTNYASMNVMTQEMDAN